MTLPRRTIDELLARYDLEPDLFDVYVEGYFDKDIIDACLYGKADNNVAIYVIDSIDIGIDLLERYGFTSGNKQRLIALSMELGASKNAKSRRYLIDRDFDYWLKLLYVSDGLRWTKYANIECYFFDSNTLNRILVVAAKIHVVDWDRVFIGVVDFVKSRFSMRIADKEGNFGFNWIDPRKEISVREGGIEFDELNYIDKLLNSNSAYERKNDYISLFEKWRHSLTGDHRFYAHGHDLVYIISHIVKVMNGYKSFINEQAIERMLVIIAAENESIKKEIIDSIII